MITITLNDEEVAILKESMFAMALMHDLTGKDYNKRAIALYRRLNGETRLSDLDAVHLASMVDQGMPVSDYITETQKLYRVIGSL